MSGDSVSPLTTVPPGADAVDYPRTSRLQGPQAADQGEARRVKLKKAAQDFESLFIYQLLKRMRATVPKSEDSGFGLETMREITDEQLAIHIARHGGIGLGEMLAKSLAREQSREAAAARPPGGENLHAPERMIKFHDETRIHQLERTGRTFTPLAAPPDNKDAQADR